MTTGLIPGPEYTEGSFLSKGIRESETNGHLWRATFMYENDRVRSFIEIEKYSDRSIVTGHN